MIEAVALSAAIALGWCLRAHLARLEMRHRETVWRSRLAAQYPATRRLTVVMTEESTGRSYTERAELHVN